MQALIVGLLVVDGCVETEAATGLGLNLRVRARDAQLMEGRLGVDEGGPLVSQVIRPQIRVQRGEGTVVLKGLLGHGGVALHLQAEGDPRHWLVSPMGYDFVQEDELQWNTRLEFSHAIEDAEITLLMQAADKNGRLGPVERALFEISSEIPAAGALVSLAWDMPVDYDLHVEFPDGTVVGSKNRNSHEPRLGEDPNLWRQGAWLDFDSNRGCLLDLRNRENVVWTASAPETGLYKVYVHLHSACGASMANFEVNARIGQEELLWVGGTLYEFDARRHSAGSSNAPGVLVGEFSVP